MQLFLIIFFIFNYKNLKWFHLFNHLYFVLYFYLNFVFVKTYLILLNLFLLIVGLAHLAIFHFHFD